MREPTREPVRAEGRLRIAIQKSGRLAEKSIALFTKCGLDFDLRKDRLLHECKEFPIDLMLVRDDDIPEYVADGVCDLGVVGENVIREKPAARASLEVVTKLGFGGCRLALAVPEDGSIASVADLAGKRIATSYPNCLTEFLRESGLEAKIVELSGSVEIAPSLRIAEAVCDLVSTGGTLRSNGLREFRTLFESQAVLVRTAREFSSAAMANDLARLLQRIDGVLKAARSKYIMMNAPREALDQIRRIIPGMEEPSVMPLGTDGSRIAIHAVAHENVFWETIENLKSVGASSILVLPIEKVIA